MKIVKKVFAVLLGLVFLASCGGKELIKNEWVKGSETLYFSEDGTLTVTKENEATEYFYKDCKGKENNKYIKVYSSKTDMEEDNYIKFLPYYVEGKKLLINSKEYNFKKK